MGGPDRRISDRDVKASVETNLHDAFPLQNMDELAKRCKQQLETFRIKELKGVLTRMGASKQGKKQVLLEKIMAVILYPERQQHCRKGLKPESVVSRDEVAKLIDDIYRKMHDPGAADLATVIENAPAGSNRVVQSDNEGFYRGKAKTQCPCGSSADMADMIKCGSPKCMVQQHSHCVIIPENEGMEREIPTAFYCERCRIQYGDPFSLSVAHPLLPTKLITSIAGSEGLSPSQNVEKSFMVSCGDQEMLCEPNYDLQVWCVLLNDKVKFRMHWPLHAQLHVNGVPVPVTNRPGHQSLGINGRDDGVEITNCTSEGVNRISLSAHDGRSFCVGIRIINHLTLDQVLSAIPSEMQGESFDTALARVCRFLGGGEGNDVDGDSDLEIISKLITVNLRCPMSGSRIKVAGRFRPCKHMAGFDLHTFVKLNQRARKWQCPICMNNFSLDNLIIDPFFTRITRAMKSYEEDITEVEMKPDGCWRPKLEGDAKLQESWRSPDGSISSENDGDQCMNFHSTMMEVKIEEGLSAEMVPLNIGSKKTWDDVWKVNRTGGFAGLANSIMPGWNQTPHNMATSRTSNATASNDENPSVCQDGGEIINQSKGDDTEVIPISQELPTNVWFNEPPGGDLGYPKSSEVIVLSDTEEDNTDEYNLRAGHCVSLSNSQFPGPIAEETEGNDKELSVRFGTGFTHIGSERDLSFTDMDCCREKSANTFDFFGAQKGASATALEHENFWSSEVHHTSFEILGSLSDVCKEAPSSCHQLVCPAPVQAGLGPTFDVSSEQQSNSCMLETNFLGCNSLCQSFVTYPYLGEAIEGANRFASTDPSLQLFLPDQPVRASAHPTAQESLMDYNQRLQDSWFSLRLGGCEFTAPSPSTVVPFCSVDQPLEAPGQLDSIAASASDLLELSNHGGQAAQRDSSAQRQTASIAEHRFGQHSRHYLTVDTDSD